MNNKADIYIKRSLYGIIMLLAIVLLITLIVWHRYSRIKGYGPTFDKRFLSTEIMERDND